MTRTTILQSRGQECASYDLVRFLTSYIHFYYSCSSFFVHLRFLFLARAGASEASFCCLNFSTMVYTCIQASYTSVIRIIMRKTDPKSAIFSLLGNTTSLGRCSLTEDEQINFKQRFQGLKINYRNI